MEGEEEVENKQVIQKHYVNGFPKESDMDLRTTKIKLKLPAERGGSSGQLHVKNLYSSCDPYMRNRMGQFEGSYVDSFTPGFVCLAIMTAYVGFFKICSPKKGEHAFISAASGTVGNLVGKCRKQGKGCILSNVDRLLSQSCISFNGGQESNHPVRKLKIRAHLN